MTSTLASRCDKPSWVACLLFAAMHVTSSRRCAAAEWQENIHVGQSSRRRIKQMSDRQTQEHYLFLWAVSKNCTQCVKYWLDNGVDVRRGQESCASATALFWATQEEANDVLPLLQEALQSASDRPAAEPLSKVRRVDATDAESSMQEAAPGIWADEDADAARLRPYFADATVRRLWNAAMKGDKAQVFAALFLDQITMYAAPATEDLPIRMFYWNLYEFVKFAMEFWQADATRTAELSEILSLLEEAERQRDDRINQYYMDFPGADLCGRWSEWMRGFVTHNADRASSVEHSNIDFWYAFRQRSEPDALAPFIGPEAWWKYDPFTTAFDCSYSHPEYCAQWKLRNWTQALGGDVEGVLQLENRLISETLSGWKCWTLSQRALVATLLCVPEDVWERVMAND